MREHVFAHAYRQGMYLCCIVHGIIMKRSHFGEEISGAANVSIFKFKERFSEENMILKCLALISGIKVIILSEKFLSFIVPTSPIEKV